MSPIDVIVDPIESVLGKLGRPAKPAHLENHLSIASLRSTVTQYCLLWVMYAVWLGSTACLRPLAIPDEGRYVGVAREMLQSNNWLVPTLDGLPFLHKPPLFYWLTAEAMRVFGVNVMAARVASVIAGASILLGLYAFLHRWTGSTLARRATLILATLPLFYGGGQFASPDMLVAACIGGSILLFAQAVLQGESGAGYCRALAAAFGVAALGMLTKGLIGIVLPGAVVLLWATCTRRLGQVWKMIAWPPGWVILITIAAPWFLLVQHRHKEFFHYFFVVQQAERFTADTFNNVQPWYFYPGILIVTAMPWSLRLSPLLLKRGWQREDPRGVRMLMVCWLAVVTVFFSIPHSKLVGYILPALPPVAFFASETMGLAESRIRLALTASLAATLCIGLAIGAHFFQHKSSAALSRALAASRLPSERVYFIGNYYFDVAFYAGLVDPVRVVDAWSPHDLSQDTWRRALVDAAAFGGTLRSPLMRTEALPAALCGDVGSWLIGAFPFNEGALSRIEPALVVDHVGLWHVTPRHPGLASRCH